MIGCNICDKEIEEHEGNNPEPLMPFEHKVCRDCNHYVTATRLQFMGGGLDPHLVEIQMSIITTILVTAHALKNSDDKFREMMNNGEITNVVINGKKMEE